MKSSSSPLSPPISHRNKYASIMVTELPTGSMRWSRKLCSTTRPIVQTVLQHLVSSFASLQAQGLPMCHIFPVSGSSLPVSIVIERRVDHINLQAEVTVSGTEMPPTWSDMNRRQRHLRILSCQSNRLADATFSKSGEA